MEENRKVVVYLKPRQHRKIKSVLALRGQNLSEFVRDMIDKFLEQQQEQNHSRTHTEVV